MVLTGLMKIRNTDNKTLNPHAQHALLAFQPVALRASCTLNEPKRLKSTKSYLQEPTCILDLSSPLLL